MRTARGAGDTTELTTPSNKAIVFDGMKFQSIYSHDPAESVSAFCPNPDNPGPDKMQFILSIWECIMVLPFVQATVATPAFIPVVTSPNFQQGDLADRVLWKRISHLYVQGSLANPANQVFINPDTTARYNTENPVVVKAKCRLDDRHGLFYVRTMVHDIFLPFSPINPCAIPDIDGCCGGGTQNSTPNCGFIPIITDFWAKVYYHTR